MTSSGSMDQECAGLASMLGVPVQSMRVGEQSAANDIRNAIDRQATSQNLSSAMREQMLSFFDKGMAAARERSDAQGIVSRLAGATTATGGGPNTRPSGSAAPSGAGTSPGGAPHARAGAATLSTSDADTLRMHDALRDLVQFAHGSNAGALSSEAEGLAWLIAAERFMSTAQLPPKLKVLAAEPLFDTLLGVPTPTAAKGNPQQIPNQLWGQYLAAASRAARESGAGAAGVGGVPPTGGMTGQGASTPGAGATGRTGHGARGGAAEMNDWRQIVGLLEQRINSFAQQIPPSDLRQTMATYAQQLRSVAVGGGPGMPSGNMQQGNMQQGNVQHPPMQRPMRPMPRSAPPSGQQPGGGAASPGPGPGSGTPSGGSSQPGGGGY